VFGIEGLVFGMYYRVFDAKAMQLHFYYSIEQENVGTDLVGLSLRWRFPNQQGETTALT
jgi:hypothetical protein